jgi:signal transduction histidine kinase
VHEVALSVEDDGRGFEPATPLSKLMRTKHFGLVSMADRVAWVNGHLTIHAQPGRGTEIVVRIPLLEMEVNDE